MKRLSLFFLAFVLGPEMACAGLRLPAIISDHAMLQAGEPIAIWGWAEPGVRVTVAFLREGESNPERTFTAISDAAGKWSGLLPSLAVGTTGRLRISSYRDAPVTIEDVLVGEVWIGGGQSNMVYTIEGRLGADPNNPQEVAQVSHNVVVAQQEAAGLPQPIRYFEVATGEAIQPLDDVKGHWAQANPGNVRTFSAVAWNFGVALQNRLHRPVGLIVSCVGGTPVEFWMSRQAIDATSAGALVESRYQGVIAYVTAHTEADLAAWKKANPTPELQLKNQKTRPAKFFPATFTKVPARHYNAMIHGLQPYTVRGVIWFQADGNRRHPLEYGELFQALIKDWRAAWGKPLPFYFVEMNNMVEDRQTKPVQPDNLCLIREQQHAGLAEPGVGMAASIDLGTKNAHFPNKKPVGERLARLALSDCYHFPMGEVNSPLYHGFTIEGSRIRLTFTDAGGLRVRGGGELKGFAIRGESGDWVWATGKIDGRDIVVWNERIPSPVAVRYAWAPNPVISVENGAGLPLCPFRTDTGSKE